MSAATGDHGNRSPMRTDGQRGRADQRVVLILAGVLVVAVAAIAYSWRLTHARAVVAARLDYPGRCAALIDDADRLVQSVQSRTRPDPEAFDLRRLAARDAEVHTQVLAQAQADLPVAKGPLSAEMNFHVRGVARHGRHPVAFIDNRTVEVGEFINGFKLIAVGDESATFLDPLGRERTVRIYGK